MAACLVTSIWIDGIKTDLPTHDVYVTIEGARKRVVLDKASAEEGDTVHIKKLKQAGWAGDAEIVSRDSGASLTAHLDARHAQGKAGRSIDVDYSKHPGTIAETIMLGGSGITDEQAIAALYSAAMKGDPCDAIDALAGRLVVEAREARLRELSDLYQRAAQRRTEEWLRTQRDFPMLPSLRPEEGPPSSYEGWRRQVDGMKIDVVAGRNPMWRHVFAAASLAHMEGRLDDTRFAELVEKYPLFKTPPFRGGILATLVAARDRSYAEQLCGPTRLGLAAQLDRERVVRSTRQLARDSWKRVGVTDDRQLMALLSADYDPLQLRQVAEETSLTIDQLAELAAAGISAEQVARYHYNGLRTSAAILATRDVPGYPTTILMDLEALGEDASREALAERARSEMRRERQSERDYGRALEAERRRLQKEKAAAEEAQARERQYIVPERDMELERLLDEEEGERARFGAAGTAGRSVEAADMGPDMELERLLDEEEGERARFGAAGTAGRSVEAADMGPDMELERLLDEEEGERARFGVAGTAGRSVEATDTGPDMELEQLLAQEELEAAERELDDQG